MTDEGYLIEAMLRIADKNGADCDFILNPTQRALDQNLTGRDLIPKARQLGVSAYILARAYVKCLKDRNTRAVVISHDQESTQRMLKRVEYYINNTKGPSPVIQNMSKNEITFPKTNSMFYIGTAGSRKFGRGDTISYLHCSEYAYWPDPLKLMAGLLQAVPKGGEIFIESTGNGLNDYHSRCIRAESGESRWVSHFFSWLNDPDYVEDLTPEQEIAFIESLNPDWEEPELFNAGIPLNRLAFRRVKLEEMDYDLSKFKQEYPSTLAECFQASGESIFHRVNLVPTDLWRKIEAHTWALEGHPRGGATYVIGCDVAGGVGKDSSTIQIICVDTGEQVFEYKHNKIDPEAFGEHVYHVGKDWGFPYLVPESNNHGILTVAVLRGMYPVGQMYVEPIASSTEDALLLHLGKRTSSRTKPLIIGRLRSDLAHSELTIHSQLLNAELSTFIEDDSGKLGAQSGCHDDLVIALAMANYGREKAALYSQYREGAKAKVLNDDPFTLEAIINEMRKHGHRFPIPSQTSINPSEAMTLRSTL
jgi:hypothetical protein